MIHDVACVSIEFGKYVFWIDPARDFLPVRYAETTATREIVRQVDYSSYRQIDGRWLLSGWRNCLLSGPSGSASETSDVSVGEFDLTSEVDDREFEVEFPAGTLVRDRRPPPSTYIVRGNGEKRVVQENELAASYEQLLATESGRGLESARGGTRQYLRWLVGSLLAVGALLYIAWRFRRSRQHPIRSG
jgi:hypothetical protein